MKTYRIKQVTYVSGRTTWIPQVKINWLLGWAQIGAEGDANKSYIAECNTHEHALKRIHLHMTKNTVVAGINYISINDLLPSGTLAIATAILLMMTSCIERKEPLLQELGVVIEKQYTPNTEDVVMGTGISTSGNIVMTTHYVGSKEKYIVIFKCQHGIVFSVNKSDVYAKLNKGDKVYIDYYEMIDANGIVKDYDFVDANKLPQ
jgi:hypothetical protein